MARGSVMKKKGGYGKKGAAHKGGRAAKLHAARKPKIPFGGMKLGGATGGAPAGLMG